MAVDLNLEDPRVRHQRLGHGVQHRERTLDDRVLAGHKEHLVEDDDLLALDDGLHVVGTTVLVLHAVDVLGLVGADIVHIEHAITVVVRVGAAVGVLESVGVLGIVGALVLVVRDAVLVVVLGAAILIGEGVDVLSLVRALVVRVEHAVTVIVGVGAAVVVEPPVDVLGLIGALVVSVSNAVTVVVLGTTVGVLEAVEVLGLLRTLVRGTGDAVTVAVSRASRDRPAHTRKRAKRRGASAGREARTTTEDDVESDRRLEAQVEEKLHGSVQQGLRDVLWDVGAARAHHAGAHQLDVDVHELRRRDTDGSAKGNLITRGDRPLNQGGARLHHVSGVGCEVNDLESLTQGDLAAEGQVPIRCVHHRATRGKGHEGDQRKPDGHLVRVQRYDTELEAHIAEGVVRAVTEAAAETRSRHHQLHERHVHADV